MSSPPVVQDELKQMVNSGSAAPQSTVNKVLAASTAFLSVVVVCLSIAPAATAKDSDPIIQSQTVIEFASEEGPQGSNICAGTKVDLPNIQCFIDEIGVDEPQLNDFALGAQEQSGVNVTKGYQGDLDVGDREPITNPYWQEGLCPVNVHWHLGSEHLSVGEYDEAGHGPSDHDGHRSLAGEVRPGYQCHHYDATNTIFTEEYDWKHCVDMHVGETYEVHWPHSNMGACGTPNQFQTPFYDGVFCNFDTVFGGSLEGAKIGVQGQVFTIVNDESYYYPDLIRGMVVDGDMGTDVAKYTGSTTGTSRNNEVCSQYTGITWQVDRKCHMVSASSFDKMCADMKAQRDDMSDDLYPHGSRELVDDALAANNHQGRKLVRGGK